MIVFFDPISSEELAAIHQCGDPAVVEKGSQGNLLAAAKFTYKCDAASTCTASRTANTNNTVIGTYTTGVMTCGGSYAALGNGGCTA